MADVEEQSQADLQKQRKELEEAHTGAITEKEADLEKHKAAIAKLSEKLKKS